MKFKKPLLFGLALMLTAGSAITLSACGKSDLKVGAQDFYAMAALSSVNYLQDEKAPTGVTTGRLSEVLVQGTNRPESVSTQDVDSLASYMDMFRDMLSSDTNKYFTNGQVTQEDVNYQDYNFKMTFTIPTNDGQQDLVMYYNEVKIDTHQEVDENEVELEINTTLNGILVDGENTYTVEGMREYEKEGNKTEVAYEFKTYSQENPKDYVRIEHEKENNEIEYEYLIYKNGVKASETSVEFENERGRKSLELEFKANQTNLKYEITEREQNVYQVRLKNKANNNEIKEIFTIKPVQNGYLFEYSNGYSEVV